MTPTYEIVDIVDGIEFAIFTTTDIFGDILYQIIVKGKEPKQCFTLGFANTEQEVEKCLTHYYKKGFDYFGWEFKGGKTFNKKLGLVVA